MSQIDKGNSPPPNSQGQSWEALADQLRQTDDTDKARELVIRLEEAIFNRQQDLVLKADKTNKREIEQEEQRLRKALDLMLEVKTKKLGFPEIK